MSENIYALGDADNVRKQMQGYLLSGDLESLSRLSTGLTEGVHLVAHLAQDLGAEVILAGGDDILLRFRPANFSETTVRELCDRFTTRTGMTMSFGVGRSTGEAFLNLARAKSMAPGTVLTTLELT